MTNKHKLTKDQELFMMNHCMDLSPSDQELADIEEYYRTPKRAHYPVEHWDLNYNVLSKKGI